MESKSDFSNLLKDYRKKNGLTQKAFASLVGLSYDTIIGYEHGRSKPSPVARKKIAEKTGIEIALIPQGKNGAKIDYSEPLTDEEREFAEINHSEIIMCYLSQGSLTELSLPALAQLLGENGWTWRTAVCTMLFSLMHWPCSTSLLTVRKEAGGWKWALAAFLLPTCAGVIGCLAVAQISGLFVA